MHAMFNPDQLSEFLKKCKDLEEQIEYEANNCERTRSHEIHEESKRLLMTLQEPVPRTNEGLLGLLEKTEERECMQILDWFSAILYGNNHGAVKEKRTADTCRWILSHGRYQEWQNTNASTILWLYGNRELNLLDFQKNTCSLLFFNSWIRQDLSHLQSD